MRYVVFIIGILLFTFGANLTLVSGLGTGAFDAINFGLNTSFGISIGFWITFNSLLALIIAAYMRKEFIKVSSFITSIIIGGGMDFWKLVFSNIQIDSISNKYILFILGILFISMGVGLYLLPKLPINPIDFLMITIKEKFNISIMKSKMLVDSICIIVALIFSGPIGIGTILSIALIGPGIDYFNKLFEKVIIIKNSSV